MAPIAMRDVRPRGSRPFLPHRCMRARNVSWAMKDCRGRRRSGPCSSILHLSGAGAATTLLCLGVLLLLTTFPPEGERACPLRRRIRTAWWRRQRPGAASGARRSAASKRLPRDKACGGERVPTVLRESMGGTVLRDVVALVAAGRRRGRRRGVAGWWSPTTVTLDLDLPPPDGEEPLAIRGLGQFGIPEGVYC